MVVQTAHVNAGGLGELGEAALPLGQGHQHRGIGRELTQFLVQQALRSPREAAVIIEARFLKPCFDDMQ
jgi:hypothetical protein